MTTNLSELQAAIADNVPNLDGFIDPQDLKEFRASCKASIAALEILSAYCEAKSHAMECRVSGKIQLALQFESACDTLYKQLPDWAKS